LEVVKHNFSRLLTLKSLRRLLNEMTNISNPTRAEANRKLLDEMIPDKVPIDVLHSVLRLLLDEQVSIRNLPLILEATAEARGQNSQSEAICEHVRQRLGFQLVAEMRRDDGTLPLIQLAPEWEDTFNAYQVDADRGLDIALPPDLFNQLAESVSDKLQAANKNGIHAALVTNTRRRRFLRTVMRAKGITNPVLSFEEIGLDARPALVGVVAA
jgi:flagellar biosynthesis protein FlhA